MHPISEESVNFMLIIDEGSRFRTARVLTTGAKQAPNAQACLHYLQEGWVQYFGHPRCLRLDPAGAFRSAAVEEWCDKHSIYSDVVPGEAHWKVGTVECAIRGVKDVMTKLCSYDEELTPQQALAEAIVTFNHKELVRGYSPAQHILGQAPDETGRFIPQGRDAHPALLIENPTGEFERSTKLRAEAEKALTDWNTQQRLLRAKHSRHRPCYDYTPGELVYYWRTQDSNKGRRQPGGKHGRFLGPARVLATETRRDDQGNAKPGGSIWLVKGRSLLKCAPEQLRRATQREELLESMSDPGQQKLSWTFHSVADAIGGTRYEDISGELPSTTEWNRAQLPEEEHQPARHRLRQKQPPSSLGGKMEGDNDPDFHDAPGAASTARNRSRSRGREGSGGVLSSDNPTAWWSTVKEEQWPDQAAAYWQDQGSAVEIEIPMPDSQRGRDRAWRDLGTYFVGSLKRRAVELSERKMTADEREAFRGAKAVEVKNFVEGRFTQCGVVVEQKPEGFELSQPSYLDNLQEIGVNATRRKDLTQPTTDREKTQLRALLGGISWHSQQVAPYLAAEVSLLLTEVSRSSVETILKANMLLANAKAKQAYKMKIHAFEENDDLVMIMWVDAANGNRAEGGSTQGLFLGMAPRSILEGSVTGVSPIAWHSQKIDRACRSPGAAEAQAAVNGEDCLYYGRYGWSELLHGSGNLREPDLIVSKTSGCLVTDSRNVYDRLITEVLVVKGAEKRTSLELLSIKESQARTQVQLRWVHSEAQLANSLTKQGGGREYELYYKMGHQWRLVEDEAMMSAKRRRENGIQPLEQKDRSKVTSGVSLTESSE